MTTWTLKSPMPFSWHSSNSLPTWNTSNHRIQVSNSACPASITNLATSRWVRKTTPAITAVTVRTLKNALTVLKSLSLIRTCRSSNDWRQSCCSLRLSTIEEEQKAIERKQINRGRDYRSGFKRANMLCLMSKLYGRFSERPWQRGAKLLYGRLGENGV